MRLPSRINEHDLIGSLSKSDSRMFDCRGQVPLAIDDHDRGPGHAHFEDHPCQEAGLARPGLPKNERVTEKVLERQRHLSAVRVAKQKPPVAN